MSRIILQRTKETRQKSGDWPTQTPVITNTLYYSLREFSFGSSSTTLLEIVLTLVKKVSQFLHWRFNKNEKVCFSPEVPIRPCRAKSDSALPGVIWAQIKPNSPIKRLFQPTLGPISALGSKSALVNWAVLALIEGAELDSKIGLYFTHPRPAIFQAKTDISDLQRVHRDKITTNFFRLACSLLSCFG